MTLLIILGAIAYLGLCFMLWACCAIAKRADEQTERLYRDQGGHQIDRISYRRGR